MGFSQLNNVPCLLNRKPLNVHYFRFIVFIFLGVNTGLSYGQDITATFKKTVTTLTEEVPKTYAEIDKVLRPSRKDTVLMRYFYNKAKTKTYYTGQAYALNQIGRVYRDISEFSRALIAFQEAMEVSKKANNLEFRVYSLNMISVVFRRTDAIKSAFRL